MNQTIAEIIGRIDTEQFEVQLVLQCAPLFVGLKPSNLLIIRRKYLSRIQRLLQNSKIHSCVFHLTEKNAILFLYERGKLQNYLSQKKNQKFLLKNGYRQSDPEKILPALRERYNRYFREKQNFPHEIGLFLGYPLEDVEGFVKNGGKNSLCGGYWKVYENVPAKRDLFRMYDLARETLIQLAINGISVAEIMEAYNMKAKNPSECE